MIAGPGFLFRRYGGVGCGRWMDAVQMTFEGIDMGGPKAAERFQPGVELLEGFRFKTIEAALGVHGGLHETVLAEHAEVLGDGGLGHAETALDVADGLLGGHEEAEDGAAVGLGEDGKDRFHPLYIPKEVYACQGINEGKLEVLDSTLPAGIGWGARRGRMSLH